MTLARRSNLKLLLPWIYTQDWSVVNGVKRLEVGHQCMRGVVKATREPWNSVFGRDLGFTATGKSPGSGVREHMSANDCRERYGTDADAVLVHILAMLRASCTAQTTCHYDGRDGGI